MLTNTSSIMLHNRIVKVSGTNPLMSDFFANILENNVDEDEFFDVAAIARICEMFPRRLPTLPLSIKEYRGTRNVNVMKLE